MDELCPCCHSLIGTKLCDECLKRLQKSLTPRSVLFSLEQNLTLRTMSRYDAAMKNFIVTCKSSSFNGLMPSQKNLIKELSHYWAKELKEEKIDLFTPIPGHPIRSYLQSDLAWFLARYLSKSLGLGEPQSLLKRKFFTKGQLYAPQKSLSRMDRKKKITEQYYVPKKNHGSLNICLVDDVCTTGSTLKLCKSLLEEAGHTVVSAIVLSKV